jgi:hypothetical protein
MVSSPGYRVSSPGYAILHFIAFLAFPIEGLCELSRGRTITHQIALVILLERVHPLNEAIISMLVLANTHTHTHTYIELFKMHTLQHSKTNKPGAHG